MVLTDANIEQLKLLIRDALLKEWKAQGHFESGKVVEEIDYQIERTFGMVSLIGILM